MPWPTPVPMFLQLTVGQPPTTQAQGQLGSNTLRGQEEPSGMRPQPASPCQDLQLSGSHGEQ